MDGAADLANADRLASRAPRAEDKGGCCESGQDAGDSSDQERIDMRQKRVFEPIRTVGPRDPHCRHEPCRQDTDNDHR